MMPTERTNCGRLWRKKRRNNLATALLRCAPLKPSENEPAFEDQPIHSSQTSNQNASEKGRIAPQPHANKLDLTHALPANPGLGDPGDVRDRSPRAGAAGVRPGRGGAGAPRDDVRYRRKRDGRAGRVHDLLPQHSFPPLEGRKGPKVPMSIPTCPLNIIAASCSS